MRKVIIDSLKATAITVGGYTFDDKKHEKEADTELVNKWKESGFHGKFGGFLRKHLMEEGGRLSLGI